MSESHRVNSGVRKKRNPPIYDYQKDSVYFAQISDTFKDAGVQELSELGAWDVQPEFSGIYFKADKSTLYRINYMSRLLSRCLAPLKSFDCPTSDALYETAKEIQWEDFFIRGKTFAVAGNLSDSEISHSKYAALRIKDAVADYFREKTGKRPDVATRNPDVQLNLHIRKDQAVISLDTSGEALHRRGYREETVSAPMQETLAAAIIRLSEWDGSVPLYDPMCGSGTLLCEALMSHCRIPAGIFRDRFGFESLPDFKRALWQHVKKESDQGILEIPRGLIRGSDMSEQAVEATRTNLMGLHHGNKVSVETSDFRDLPSLENHFIITNPPYGIRMGKGEDLEQFYGDLGDFLKQKCNGSSAFVYFGDREYIKSMGLKAAWKKPLAAGGLDGRLVKYELY